MGLENRCDTLCEDIYIFVPLNKLCLSCGGTQVADFVETGMQGR